mgnify:FL=1|jgi:hypothetical protein
MVEETKQAIDVAAASTALLTMAAWLPPTASLLTIVWMALRIYESDTVQKLVHGDKQLDKQD